MARKRDFSSEQTFSDYRATKVDGWMSDGRPQRRDDAWLNFTLVDAQTGKSYGFVNLWNATRPGLPIAGSCTRLAMWTGPILCEVWRVKEANLSKVNFPK